MRLSEGMVYDVLVPIEDTDTEQNKNVTLQSFGDCLSSTRSRLCGCDSNSTMLAVWLPNVNLTLRCFVFFRPGNTDDGTPQLDLGIRSRKHLSFVNFT